MNLKLDKKIIGYVGCFLAAYAILFEFLPLFFAFETIAPFSFKALNFSFMPFFEISEDAIVGMELMNRYGGYGNLITLTFNILFLIGSVLYLRTDGKETRLIRFSYGIIFINGLLGLLYVFAFFLSSLTLLNLIYLILQLLLLAFSYLSLKEIASTKKLLEDSYEFKGETIVNYVEATAWQRFLHLVIDWIIVLSFVFGVFSYIIYKFDLPRDSQIVLYGLAIVIQLIYYILQEWILGATPGKYLTETRTVKEGEDKLPLGAAMIRSLCRFVPFERIAFLFGARWHDTWSDTTVLKEQPTGAISGKQYRNGIFLLFVTMFALYFAVGAFIRYQREVKYEEQRKEQTRLRHKKLIKDLDRLSPDAFIKLSYDEWYKVERVTQDTVYVVFVVDREIDAKEVNDIYYAEYENDKNLIPILRTQIKESIDAQAQEEGYIDDTKIEVGSDKHSIIDIAFVDEPLIKGIRSSSTRYGNEEEKPFSFTVKNDGFPLHIVHIQQQRGEIEWDKESLNNPYDSNTFSGKLLSGTMDYEAIFTHETPMGHRIRYLVKIHRTNSDTDYSIQEKE